MRSLRTGKSFPFWEFVIQDVLFGLSFGCGRPVLRAGKFFLRCPPLRGEDASCRYEVQFDECGSRGISKEHEEPDGTRLSREIIARRFFRTRCEWVRRFASRSDRGFREANRADLAAACSVRRVWRRLLTSAEVDSKSHDLGNDRGYRVAIRTRLPIPCMARFI